jgi:hypothetical protein
MPAFMENAAMDINIPIRRVLSSKKFLPLKEGLIYRQEPEG